MQKGEDAEEQGGLLEGETATECETRSQSRFEAKIYRVAAGSCMGMRDQGPGQASRYTPKKGPLNRFRNISEPRIWCGLSSLSHFQSSERTALQVEGVNETNFRSCKITNITEAGASIHSP